MNTKNIAQAVIEDVANVQKHFIDGIVSTTKTFTATSDRRPLLKGLDATQGLIVNGIKARGEFLNVVYSNVGKIESLPAPVAKANTQVKEFADKWFAAEEKIVKNAFESLERYIPAAGNSAFLNSLQTPVQTVLDLTKKAFEVPANLVKRFTAKAEVVAEKAADKATEAATATVATVTAATEKVEEIAKEATAKVEKKVEAAKK